MYKKKRILALIPARGGSKGIKNKNIVDLCGKPLIAYTIEAAKKSAYIDKIIVSTDSEDIKRISQEYGADVPFTRPNDLSTDTATTLDVVLHTIDFIKQGQDKYDTLILLQPTSPLRTYADIDMAIEKYFLHNELGLVSVSEVNDNPILIRTVTDNEVLIPLLDGNSTCRRQNMPRYYRVNGSIYINKIEDINGKTSFNDNKLAYIMPKNCAIDIDELVDLNVAEYYLKNRFDFKNNKSANGISSERGN